MHLQLFELCRGSNPISTVYSIALWCCCGLYTQPERGISIETDNELATRLQITWDSVRRLPKLEEVDAPLELFKAQAKEAKLACRELLSKEPAQRAKDLGTEGCFVILAFAWQEEALQCL